MPQEHSADERIQREARIVGLRGFRPPSLEAVEQRRMQLWVLTTILLICISATVVVLSWWPTSSRSFLSPHGLRWGILGLSLAFSAYAIEKEVHLRRLARLLIQERVLTAALSNRVREVTLLLEAGRAMNALLDLDAVLLAILDSAHELLEARSASIMVLEDDELVAAHVCGNEEARGRRVRVGEAIAGRVAVTLEPLLINGRADPAKFPGLLPRAAPVESALCVPLVHRETLLGVLNVNAEPDREFTEYDLRALSLFAEEAAVAMTNARLYETERSHVAELEELDRLKSELIDLVTHELRTPLTAVVAASQTAQRPEMRSELPELLEIITRNGKHLASMLDELLTAVRIDQRRGIGPLTSIDAAEMARGIAREFALTDRPIIVSAPTAAPVVGNVDGLRRILNNLVDNAYKYGLPPVRVVVEPAEDGGVTLWVIDAGPGVPEPERERIFERFARLSGEGGGPGLGLGLSIVRALTVGHGGTVDVHDAPGGGAAFRVCLPSVPPHAQAV